MISDANELFVSFIGLVRYRDGLIKVFNRLFNIKEVLSYFSYPKKYWSVDGNITRLAKGLK